MKTVAVLAACAVFAVVSDARAEPGLPSWYLEGGVLFGAAAPVTGWNVMPAVDGGHRWTDVLWLHAGVGYGPTISNLGSHGPNHGSNGLVRSGIEIHEQLSKTLAATAGLDLGVAYGTWAQYEGTEILSSLTFAAIPRVGFEIGGGPLRVRVGLEAAIAIADRETSTPEVSMTGSAINTSGIELAVGAAFLW